MQYNELNKATVSFDLTLSKFLKKNVGKLT